MKSRRLQQANPLARKPLFGGLTLLLEAIEGGLVKPAAISPEGQALQAALLSLADKIAEKAQPDRCAGRPVTILAPPEGVEPHRSHPLKRRYRASRNGATKMQPHPEYRRFEEPDAPGATRPPASAVRPGVDLPTEGRAVRLDRDIPCPCDRCTGCGGFVSLTAMLWVDDWPVTTPEVGQPVLEYPDRGARTLHLAIAPAGLEAQAACTEGCELSPGEWEAAEGAAFISLCRAYVEATEQLRRAKRDKGKRRA